MRAFLDGTCTKCGKRIGWCGDMMDKPPCSGCGHQTPKEDLQKEQDKLNKIMEEFE